MDFCSFLDVCVKKLRCLYERVVLAGFGDGGYCRMYWGVDICLCIMENRIFGGRIVRGRER